MGRTKKSKWRKSEAAQDVAKEIASNKEDEIMEAKPSDSLFFVDTAGSKSAKKSRTTRSKKKVFADDVEKTVTKTKGKKSTQNKAKKDKKAKSDESTVETETIEKVKAPEPKTLTRKEKKELKRKRVKQSALMEDVKNLDLWATAAPVANLDIWGSANPAPKRAKRTKHKRHAGPEPKVGGEGSAPVLRPLPGTSFNPEAGAHKELIEMANAIDEKEREEKKSIQNQLRGESIIPDVELPKYDWEEPEELPEPTKLRKKRTRTDRNRLARKKITMQELERKKAQKVFNKQLHSLPALIKDIDEEENSLEKRHADIEKSKETNPKQRAKIGKHAFKPEFPDFALTEELEEMGGSLRNLKPTVKTVKNQFKNFQRRNLVDIRVKHKLKRRYRYKEFNKFKGDN